MSTFIRTMLQAVILLSDMPGCLLGDYLSGSNVSVAQRGSETNSFLEAKFESSSGSLTKEFL